MNRTEKNLNSAMKKLGTMIDKMGKNSELPADPNWLHRLFPATWYGMEEQLDIMSTDDRLEEIYKGIRDVMDNAREYQLVDYDLVDEHAKQGQLINDLKGRSVEPMDNFYIDDEVKLEPDDEPLSYQNIADRVQDYLDDVNASEE